ncbi:hypothetical protein [Streptomyces sp. NRRL S-1448]|uniref:hypothetical protein n=1 Tax=Streptomyces sp. NRRL S-1448 TaxID=1463883 RepID=UPI0004BF3526|nr:hypothetical protein [Streptomyces sp. NRRL S-1448]
MTVHNAAVGDALAAAFDDPSYRMPYGDHLDGEGEYILLSDLTAWKAIVGEAEKRGVDPAPYLHRYRLHRERQDELSQPHLRTIAMRVPELADLIAYAYEEGYDILHAARKTAELLTRLTDLEEQLARRTVPVPDLISLERHREEITPDIVAVATGAAGSLTACMVNDSPAVLRATFAHVCSYGTTEVQSALLALLAEDARALRDLAREAAGPFKAASEEEAAYLARISQAELETNEHAVAEAWTYRLALYAVAYPDALPDLVELTHGNLLRHHSAGWSPIRPQCSDCEDPPASIQSGNDQSTVVGTARTVNINHNYPEPTRQ